jgi:hypothetical protein
MESRTQRERHRQLLKFGDRILLAGIDVKGFVSATTALTPQVTASGLISEKMRCAVASASIEVRVCGSDPA